MPVSKCWSFLQHCADTPMLMHKSWPLLTLSLNVLMMNPCWLDKEDQVDKIWCKPVSPWFSLNVIVDDVIWSWNMTSSGTWPVQWTCYLSLDTLCHLIVWWEKCDTWLVFVHVILSDVTIQLPVWMNQVQPLALTELRAYSKYDAQGAASSLSRWPSKQLIRVVLDNATEMHLKYNWSNIL